jgi:mercuric ion transport protein
VSTPPKAPALLNYLSLFTSMGTLLCCALPSVLVLLGLGTTMVSLLSAFPLLVTLSKHKALVFGISGTVIIFSFVNLYYIAPRLQAKALSCDVGDPRCRSASRFSRIVLWFAAALYIAGFFVAFALGPILTRLEG